MPQAIGSALTGLTQFNVNTQMPTLTDSANIQEALRLYHYGAPSGTGIGQYDPTNTNPANLVNPSIAHSLYNLQTQITNISGSLGVQASTWTSKGALVSATAASTVQVLTLPSQSTANDGFVLTINYSGTSTGLNWAAPAVTPTNTITFTNKTHTAPRITSASHIADSNGNELIVFPSAVASAVNEITISNAITAGTPSITASGSDPNISLNLLAKGTGTVQVGGLPIVTTTGTQTLTNKTLTSPTINSPTVTQLYLSDSLVIFEGSTADNFETTLGVIDPTADRTINLPNVDGTVITTGNLSSITAVGTVTSGTFPAANLSGTSLPATITGSSLTSVGALSSLMVGGDATVTGKLLERISTNAQTVTAYTVVAADDSKMIEMNNANANTVTVPNLNTIPVGAQIHILQTGSGQTTVVAGSNVTINGNPGLKLRGQYSMATLIKRVTATTDIWVLVGDLIA